MRLQLTLHRLLRIEVLRGLLSLGTDTGRGGLVIPIQRRIAQRADRFMLQIGQGQRIDIVPGKAARAVRSRDSPAIRQRYSNASRGHTSGAKEIEARGPVEADTRLMLRIDFRNEIGRQGIQLRQRIGNGLIPSVQQSLQAAAGDHRRDADGSAASLALNTE